MSPESITSLNGRLVQGNTALMDYIDELEPRFEEIEPRVLAFLPDEGRFDRVRREAKALIDRYPDPNNRPSLFGIPIGIKDILHVDGFTTRAGTSVPPELFQGEQSDAVTMLKRAGALILGKTVTTEFAYFAPGPTRHPMSDALAEDHTPGGSSSGSAAAVAAGLSPVALGTQTIGSIARPAAFCGVVGFKPSYGRISTNGVLPLSESADTVGFFVTHAADIGPIASVLISDWRAVGRPPNKPVLGVPGGAYVSRVPSSALDHFRSTCDRLAMAGYRILEVPVFQDFEQLYIRHNVMVAAEAAAVHDEWYTAYGERYHPKTAELVERGRRVAVVDYQEALASRMTLRMKLHDLMDDTGLDLWLSPSALGTAPRGLESTGDPVMNLPWTHAGLPTVTLPSGKGELGLPLGLQIAGRFGEDEALVANCIDLGLALNFP